MSHRSQKKISHNHFLTTTTGGGQHLFSTNDILEVLRTLASTRHWGIEIGGGNLLGVCIFSKLRFQTRGGSNCFMKE